MATAAARHGAARRRTGTGDLRRRHAELARVGVVDAAQKAQREFVVEVLLRKESTVKRILLFIVTNLAVVLVLSVVLHLTGLDRYASGGNMGGLLMFAAVFGFGG